MDIVTIGCALAQSVGHLCDECAVVRARILIGGQIAARISDGGHLASVVVGLRRNKITAGDRVAVRRTCGAAV